MSIAQIWIENDWVIRILIVALMVVLVLGTEKIYQYIRTYLMMQKLGTLQTLDQVHLLPSGLIRDTLEDINAFKGSREALYNAHVGVKLDLFEQSMMRFVSLIGLIAVLSPMLGLIGTFIGVWHVFEGVGSVGLNDPAVIARGIKEVLIDTMAGLVVAVIAMIFYKFFEFVSTKNVSIFEEKLYRLIRESDAQKS